MLVNNSEVTKEYLEKPITIPYEHSELYMHAFLDGARDFRKKIQEVISEQK